MRSLEKSPYSDHFNRLVVLGGWLPETKNPRWKNFLVAHRLLLNTLCMMGCCSLFADFYHVFGDLKKMAWNLCVSILFTGAFTKMLQVRSKKELINDLRMRLHRSAESKAGPEYADIHEEALKELRFLRMALYGSGVVFVPVWLVSRYYGRVRELPIPFRLPFEIDMQDDSQYTTAFVITGLAGIFGLFFGTEVEMAMFALFIQLSREYKILMKDIPKLNLLYLQSNFVEKQEVNPMLRRSRERMIIKNLSVHQREIIECVRVFENCYSQPFLHQFFGVSSLITLLGLQCLLENVDVFGSLVYQMGYLIAITIDLFMVCWFSTRLKLLCFQVGETVYSTHWYKMERTTCKSLVMLILRSQHPPKLTIAKLQEMNLNAFMNGLSSICSWLVLLREYQKNVKSNTQ